MNNRIEKLIKGLHILLKYCNEDTDINIQPAGFMHEIIICVPPYKVREADIAELERNYFFGDDEFNNFYTQI